MVLRGLIWRIVLAVLENALVLWRIFEDRLTNLRAVVVHFREFDLKFKTEKCALFQSLVELLGRKANQSGVEMGDEHIEAMRK